jgi:hypothetical protein
MLRLAGIQVVCSFLDGVTATSLRFRQLVLAEEGVDYRRHPTTPHRASQASVRDIDLREMINTKFVGHVGDCRG